MPKKIVLTVFSPNFWAGYATGFIERLLRAAQKVLGCRMQLFENWLRTTGINDVEYASSAAFQVIVGSCFVFQTLIVAASSVVAKSVFN